MNAWEKALFRIFINEREELQKYEQIKGLVKQIIFETEKEKDIKHYDNYVKLMNSINNAGHEERRSNDISFISKLMSGIDLKYEN